MFGVSDGFLFHMSQHYKLCKSMFYILCKQTVCTCEMSRDDGTDHQMNFLFVLLAGDFETDMNVTKLSKITCCGFAVH